MADQMPNIASNDAGREILVRGASALARGPDLASTLETLLAVAAEQVGVESAVVVIVDAPDQLRIVASTGLPDAALSGLSGAIRNPGHPIARTVREPLPTFDVQPTVPGGPALRSHLPLIVARGGTDVALGVLALAHHQPLDAHARLLLEATANLAAVAVQLGRVTSTERPASPA
jgi:GAF domain-containing protein